jgi:PPM family protein phosphatase
MSFLLTSAARETTGARSGQEDAYQLWPTEGVVSAKGEGVGLLAVLADGMGGHTGGAVAGQTACKTFAEVFAATQTPFDERLKTALHASNDALAKGVEQNAALRGMGCTLVAAWIDDLGLRWTSVGDSLLLLYRLPDVIRLNADHSLGSFLDEQARQNRISRSEARRNRNRNALRSALTGSKIDLIDLRGEPLELRAGDWVVLASDGIGSLAGDEIADVIYRLRQASPEEMADALIAAVKQKAVVDQDNTTVVAVRVEDAKQASDDVTTRIVMRPGQTDDADLRTRRIGVSRPLRNTSKSRKAAVWLATAAVLLISAAAIMIALPALRPPVASSPDVTGPTHTTAPAKAGTERSLTVPAPVPARLPAEQAPKAPGPASPPAPQDKSSGEGEDGAASRATTPKAVAPKPGTPPASQKPGGEGEEGGASRAPRSAPNQIAPPKATEEGEDSGPAPRSKPKASAVSRPPSPDAPPPDPSREGEEVAPRANPSKPSSAAKPSASTVPPAKSVTEGEAGAPRSTLGKAADPNAPAKARSGVIKPSASPPGKPAAPASAKPTPDGDQDGKPARPPKGEASQEDQRDFPWRTNTLSGSQQP